MRLRKVVPNSLCDATAAVASITMYKLKTYSAVVSRRRVVGSQWVICNF